MCLKSFYLIGICIKTDNFIPQFKSDIRYELGNVRKRYKNHLLEKGEYAGYNNADSGV